MLEKVKTAHIALGISCVYITSTTPNDDGILLIDVGLKKILWLL